MREDDIDDRGGHERDRELAIFPSDEFSSKAKLDHGKRRKYDVEHEPGELPVVEAAAAILGLCLHDHSAFCRVLCPTHVDFLDEGEAVGLLLPEDHKEETTNKEHARADCVG